MASNDRPQTHDAIGGIDTERFVDCGPIAALDGKQQDAAREGIETYLAEYRERHPTGAIPDNPTTTAVVEGLATAIAGVGVVLLVGVWLWGPGSGLYIGSGLGPGPRDGLMTGLARRGLRVGPVRSGIELSALAVGFLLGGTVGIGTLVFALGVGPNVAWWLPRLTVEPAEPQRARANLTA